MKKGIIGILLAFASFSIASAQNNSIASAKPGVEYGAGVKQGKALQAPGLEKQLQKDSVYQGLVEAKVIEVCKKKGCFIQVARAGEGDPILVRFKDYGFFMPQDIVGKTVLLDGIAKVSKTSVKQLQHWAQDAGKSPEEIASITQPKTDIEIIASGVKVLE